MPIPAGTCLQLDIDLSEFLDLSIDMPGGASIQAQLKPGEFPTLSAIIGSMLEPLNAAMTPLAPFFNLLDVVIELVNCIQAVPDAITSLNPVKLVKAIEKLLKAVAKLSTLFPPLSIPVMVVGICKTISAALLALITELENQIEAATRISAGRAKADRLAAIPSVAAGAAALAASLDCAQADLDLAAQCGSSSLGPLNKFIDLLNAFMGLVPGLPTLGGINASGAAEEMLDPLRQAVTVLAEVCASIPV